MIEFMGLDVDSDLSNDRAAFLSFGYEEKLWQASKIAGASLSNCSGQSHSIRLSFPHCDSHQQSNPAEGAKTVLQKQACCGSAEVSAALPIVSDCSTPSSGSCNVKLSVCPRPKLSEGLPGAIKL